MRQYHGNENCMLVSVVFLLLTLWQGGVVYCNCFTFPINLDRNGIKNKCHRHHTSVVLPIPLLQAASKARRRSYDEEEDDWAEIGLQPQDEIDETLNFRYLDENDEEEEYLGNYDDDYEDDYYYDDEIYDDDEEVPRRSAESSGGNYWYNPAGKPDSILTKAAVSRKGRRPSSDNYYYDDDDDETMQQIRRRRKPTTFRNTLGPMEPPKLLQDFYKQFFWYGIDDDNVPGNRDNRMFTGGTRGKFNGLDFVQGRKNPRRRRNYETNDDEDYGTNKNPEPQNLAPFPSFFRNDGLKNEVTSWFDDDEEAEIDEDENGTDYFASSRGEARRQQQKRRRKDDDQQSPVIGANIIDSIIGVNTRDREMRAAEYDTQWSLRKPRKQYQTQKETINDDDDLMLYDDDVESNTRSNTNLPTNSPSEVVVTIEGEKNNSSTTPSSESDTNTTSTKDQLLSTTRANSSWRERADAQERIPPAGIECWGPRGPLGMDARERIALCAKEDLDVALRQVKICKDALLISVQFLKECQANANTERKQLQTTRGYLSAAQGAKLRARIRKLELEVRDAALSVRQCQEDLQYSQEELEAQKLKNWALLSQAEGEAFLSTVSRENSEK